MTDRLSFGSRDDCSICGAEFAVQRAITAEEVVTPRLVEPIARATFAADHTFGHAYFAAERKWQEMSLDDPGILDAIEHAEALSQRRKAALDIAIDLFDRDDEEVVIDAGFERFKAMMR